MAKRKPQRLGNGKGRPKVNHGGPDRGTPEQQERMKHG